MSPHGLIVIKPALFPPFMVRKSRASLFLWVSTLAWFSGSVSAIPLHDASTS